MRSLGYPPIIEKAPTISVVVATHNRSHLLPGLVAALEAQEGTPPFEVVLVDDCSGDDTAEVLERLADEASFPLTVLRAERNAGPAAARNLGWRAARAPGIVFTDDDCVPDRRWLAEIAAALDEAPLVQGPTAAPREAAGRGPFARILVINEFSWKFETCNVAYHRSLLSETGGFDEQFPQPFGEDCDLGWRALELGARPRWAADAFVVHRVETTGSRLGDWVATLRDTRRLVFAALMVRKHPGLRRHLAGRWFYKPHHPLALLAAAAIVGASASARIRPLVVLVLPWLVYRAVLVPLPAPRRWLWAVLPLNLVADLAAVWATLRGAVRYRTFLI